MSRYGQVAGLTTTEYRLPGQIPSRPPSAPQPNLTQTFQPEARKITAHFPKVTYRSPLRGRLFANSVLTRYSCPSPRPKEGAVSSCQWQSTRASSSLKDGDRTARRTQPMVRGNKVEPSQGQASQLSAWVMGQQPTSRQEPFCSSAPGGLTAQGLEARAELNQSTWAEGVGRTQVGLLRALRLLSVLGAQAAPTLLPQL